MDLTGLLTGAEHGVFAGDRRAVFLGAAFGSFVAEHDEALFGEWYFDGIPTMVTRRELALLLNLFGTITFSGSVLEIGPYLGGSTSAIGRGLARSGFTGTYHVLDSFAWGDPEFVERVCRECAPLPISALAKEYTRKGDFGAVFSELHAGKPYSGFMRVHRTVIPYGGDAVAYSLTEQIGSGTRLGAVFVDGFKSWSATYAGMKALLPHLEKDALLIFQDFSWIDCDWLPILAACLHGKMLLLMKVDNTAVFRLADNDIGGAIENFGKGPVAGRHGEYASILKAWASGMYHAGDDVGHLNHTAQRWMMAQRLGDLAAVAQLRGYLSELCANLDAQWLDDAVDRLRLDIHAVGGV